MKRVLRLLIRLYPAWWRSRYGGELEALLEDSGSNDVWDIFRGAMEMQMKTWSFARIVTVCGIAGALVAVAAAFSMPYRYQSTALLKATPAPSATYWKTLASAAFTPQSLADIARQERLYANASTENSIDRLRRGIRIESVGPNGAQVSFAYEDPFQAQRVSQDLVGRMIAANLNAQVNSTGQVLELAVPAGLPHKQIAKLGKASLGIPAGLLFGVVLALIFRRHTPIR